jgi:hypothetical protein
MEKNSKFKPNLRILKRCSNTQHSDTLNSNIQHNYIQPNDTQNNNIQHNDVLRDLIYICQVVCLSVCLNPVNGQAVGPILIKFGMGA